MKKQLAHLVLAASLLVAVPAAAGEFWPSLVEMTAAERANAELRLEPPRGSAPEAWAEARAIGDLWNAGDFEAAIERARGFHRYGDPGRVAVAFSPRTLVAGEPGFGPDIRIGTRDSLYGCSFDRLNNGWLFASFPCRRGSQTLIYSYRSTDDGATWAELASFSWNYADYVRTTAAVCHGNYLVIAIAIKGLSSHQCNTARISATTGQVVPYPGDTVFITAFDDNPSDTIVELAGASSEDQYPGATIYLFGRTRAGALRYAWTDSSCRRWRPGNTNVQTRCDNGLDCSYNEGYTSKYIWASWLWNYDADIARLVHGYWEAGDTAFQTIVFTAAPVAHSTSNWLPTAISAYRDTIQSTYLAAGLKEVCQIYNCDCETGNRHAMSLTDTWVTRDLVENTLRRGGGSAVAYRNHFVAERQLLFRYSPQVAGPYTEPDTVSERSPDPAVRIRVEKLSDGEYGVAWVSIGDSPPGAAYFDRVTGIGIAEPSVPHPVEMGLEVRSLRDGARLAFDNPVAGPVRVRVFDIAGRQAFLREERMAAGRRSIDLAPGVSGAYVCVVESGGERASASFAFAR